MKAKIIEDAKILAQAKSLEKGHKDESIFTATVQNFSLSSQLV